MPVFVSRLFQHLKRRASWALPIELFLSVYFSSWLLMIWAEPTGARVVQPDVYWWWFAGTVTPAGAGPGEHYPTTTQGQLVGVYVIVGGIVTITMLFTRLARMIETARGHRMKGQQMLNLSGHIVLLGYSAGRTERIIEELVAEERREIVICAWNDQAPEHPSPQRDDIHFTRGNLTDDDVLRRADLPRAAAILVDASDDDEALKVTVAATYVGPNVHVVVAVHDLAHARTISRVAENAYCIQWHSIGLITAELLDAGMSDVYGELMTHGDRNTYSIRVPSTLPDRTFGEFQQALGRWNAATVVAVRTDAGLLVSPSWYEIVPVDATLYYVAGRRLRTRDLERYVDRSERASTFSERELLRADWH